MCFIDEFIGVMLGGTTVKGVTTGVMSLIPLIELFKHL
jgi:hypothetical protein